MFKKAINELFIEFDKYGIKYLIERNYESLPHRVDNDIDLLISYEDLKIFKNIIDKALSKYNYIKVLDGISLGTNKLIFINKNINDEIIRIDLNYMFHYKGYEYLDINSILNNRLKYKNFYIPKFEDEVVMSLFTNYINNGFIKEKYKKIIVENFKSLKEYNNLFISKSFINELCFRIANEEWGSVNKLVRKIRRNIIIKNLLNHNNSIQRIAIFIKRLIRDNTVLIKVKDKTSFKILENNLANKGMKCIEYEDKFFIKNFIKMIFYKKLNGYLFIGSYSSSNNFFSNYVEI